MLERWEMLDGRRAPFEVEYRIRRADGTYRWYLGRSVCLRDDRRVTGWVGTATDIEDRKLAEERQAFLAEAGWVLGSSLDYEQTLADVARLAVPRVADWCAVDIFVDGKLERLALEHADPLKLALARELEEPMLARGRRSRRRTTEPVLVTEIDERALAAFRFDESQLEIARALAPRSYVTVPLTARGEVFGSITLVTAESGRVYGEEDAALAAGARPPRGGGDRQRAPLRGVGAAQPGGARARGRRRRRRPRRPRRRDPALEHRRDDDHRRRRRRTRSAGRSRTSSTAGSEISPRIPVASKPGEPVRAETVPVEFGGRELWISGSGVGFEEGTVYAFRDLTEERALEEMKADFVATVSHELRTPLAAIYGSAQTIRRTDIDLDPEIHDQLLGVIASESDRLGTIVNDLLVAGRLDADQLPVTVEQLRSRPSSRGSVVEAARTHLPGGGRARAGRAGADAASVVADPGQLHQVLVNLVDNAIKYSPEGGPVALSVANGDGAIRFAVADTGLGIPPSEHRRIFEKFYRLDPDMTRGIGGTGLGLYICRELVRRMDGKIWVESKLGEGSTFFVELPAAARSAA